MMSSAICIDTEAANRGRGRSSCVVVRVVRGSLEIDERKMRKKKKALPAQNPFFRLQIFAPALQFTLQVGIPRF